MSVLEESVHLMLEILSGGNQIKNASFAGNIILKFEFIENKLIFKIQFFYMRYRIITLKKYDYKSTFVVKITV